MSAMVDKGIVIIQSTERNQSKLYEFFIPNSDNHDFIYLTGLETANATLILCPGSETYPEILYIDGDIKSIQKLTGISASNQFPQKLPACSTITTGKRLSISIFRDSSISASRLRKG